MKHRTLDGRLPVLLLMLLALSGVRAGAQRLFWESPRILVPAGAA